MGRQYRRYYTLPLAVIPAASDAAGSTGCAVDDEVLGRGDGNGPSMGVVDDDGNSACPMAWGRGGCMAVLARDVGGTMGEGCEVQAVDGG